MVNCCRSLGKNRRPGNPDRSSSRSASPEMKFVRSALSEVHGLSTLLPEAAGGLTRSSQARLLTSSRSPHRHKCSVRQINMTISLAFLAPDLVKAAVGGRLPRGIGVERLRDAPAEWSRQFEALGLNPQ